MRWVDQTGEELRRARKPQGFSLNRWKHRILNKLKGRALQIMNSTLTLHLFNCRRWEKENDTHNKLTSTERSTPSRHKATRIPNSAAKPWSFLCQNAEVKCTIKSQSLFPKSPTMKMTKKIHNIGKLTHSLASRGRAHHPRSCFNQF